MKSTPDIFYEQLLLKLEMINSQTDISCLKEQLNKAKTGSPSRLNYLVSKDFNIVSAFGESTIDMVFSQAAFEHFDDIESTILQLNKVCKSGATFVAEINLKTHSRWIRDKDPDNIYRYPTGFTIYSGFAVSLTEFVLFSTGKCLKVMVGQI